MTEQIIGNAKYRCNKCSEIYKIESDKFDFEISSSFERQMGRETQFISEIDQTCLQCGNSIKLIFEIWEYPLGSINLTKEKSSGAIILNSHFVIQGDTENDYIEKTGNLLKYLLTFQFDNFSAAFVKLWLEIYKKAPKPTAILSLIFAVISVLGSVVSIYELENESKSKIEKKQDYDSQFNLLRKTEQNLNDLSIFITNKKTEIEVTRNLIKELETKKLELEPIVKANEETVQAIFLQQKKAIENDIWKERTISFFLGILASLIASIIWHFAGRNEKKKLS